MNDALNPGELAQALGMIARATEDQLCDLERAILERHRVYMRARDSELAKLSAAYVDSMRDPRLSAIPGCAGSDA